jgi:hypothetical protein
MESGGDKRMLFSEVLDLGSGLGPVGRRVAKEQLSELSLRQPADPATAGRGPHPNPDHRTT